MLVSHSLPKMLSSCHKNSSPKMHSSCHKRKRMNNSSVLSTSTANRIDDLPDAILCHILSFLTIKQAAATSILSKRWKPVWLSLLDLNFDDKIFKDFTSFRKFVNSMFTLRDKNNSIRSFKLKCRSSSRFTQKQYDGILKKAMNYRIKNLNFNMANKKRLTKLPPRIFSFKMLEVLKLSNMEASHLDQVDFPHLKTLHLNGVNFKSHEDIVKFLLGCPILENLLSDVSPSNRMYNRKEILNPLPNLVNVRLFGLNTPMALICKTKNLHMEEVWRTDWTNLPMFENLTYLNIRIQNMTEWKFKECFENGTPLLGILPHVPKLQHLYIEDCWNTYWNDPPVVSECLSLQLKTFVIGGYKGSEYEFGLAKYILKHSKVLEIMAFETSNPQMLLKLCSCVRGSTICKLYCYYYY